MLPDRLSGNSQCLQSVSAMRVDEAAPFIIVNSDWGVSTVLGAYKLGMVIDLSYKDRGHEQTQFEAAGVTHVKIPIPGKRVI